MIVGIGVDVVDLTRFERAADRTPALLERLFTRAERKLPLHSLAGRFAAKEALIKAIGDSTGVRWHDMEVVSNELGDPSFVLHNAVSRIVADRGIDRIHLSMSHDAGIAVAYVIAESADSSPTSVTGAVTG
ncbi:MAG TPA: holo-ACP synthase [Galbitalea sp.]|jgi:holo-[acyl-carrier protein] synthase|nr:holo-ACP synthase [Galbitalea sp.]